ncbi:SDR family NAD(P)-dependent oxidoreductase [Streptomyces sp. SID11385]|uniref:SDR family NAD(P)-dependent oxidoreductase n=1 Tax=Streptomyces sp. SID11385 TaxID=2706031 RepID=UPI0013C83AFE|nr:SDR family NAD(P)-dependent oxidoreductase [Streptomyces sp. SID11385]NEA37806.1 SDR family oxidoreductase [Streptomyces sp. SID11385]
MPPVTTPRTALLVGASRGLGHGLAAAFVDRGWDVIGTARDPSAPSPLTDLAERSGGHVSVERLDVDDPEQVGALRARLAGRQLDVLFVNSGVTSHEDTPVGLVPTEDFVRVMVTNALGPMRVIETLADLVADDGLIGAMSSGQGSITNNTAGGREVYRGSKAALNMFLRGFAVRQEGTRRSILLLAPGWIRTALGGSEAPYTVEESIPLLMDVVESRLGRPGLAYLDREGRVVPW